MASGCKIIENWNQYKDLEYYPDRVCMCGCGGRIKVKPGHKYGGIPEYLRGHSQKRKVNSLLVLEVEAILSGKKEAPFCKCGCGGRIVIKSQHRWQGIPKYIQGHSSRNGTRTGKNNPMWRQSHSKESCKKMEEAALAGYESGRVNPFKDKGHTAECIQENRERQRKNWQNPEYKEKQLKAIFKGLKLLPNKPEKFLDKLFQRLLPNQIKYTGDGKDKDSIIVGKCPDFIFTDGQKKIIEHFGEYHHGEGVTGISNKQHEQERIACFAKEGYQTLVIWEHELNNLQQLEKRVEGFNSG